MTAVEVKAAGKAFDKALVSYNASLNVRFDLDEYKEKEANKIPVELPEEKRQ